MQLRLAYGRIDDLEHTDGESSSFTSTRLGLGDGVAAFAYLHDGARLDGGGGFIAVCIDTTKKVLFQVHLQSASVRKCDQMA